MGTVKDDRWSVERITTDVGRLGVGPGDLLMVHVSLRAIGPVEGGADGVLDALHEAIGPAGTLFVNVGARDDLDWVNDRPEEDRPGLLEGTEPFDCLRTPADPDVGVLAEVFRTRPGTKVSDHPEGRFGASGPLAADLLDDVPWDDCYGSGSPLDRFVQAGGQVLRLGADPDTLTIVHYAEHLAPLPHKRRVRRHRLVAGKNGGPPEVRTVDCLDDSAGIVDHPGEDYFTTILHTYLATGRATVGQVGNAVGELIDAADVVDHAVAWMAGNLA